MVVLQLLVWLCRPMREWQSLPHMGKMRLKEGKVELFLRRTRFSSAFWWRFTFAFSFLLSLSVSSEHDQSQIFPVVWIKMLWGHVSKRLWTAGRRTRLSRLLLLIVFFKNFLGMCPSSMRWTGPSHLRRRWLRRECMLGKPARDSISLLGMWYCHLMPKMCRSIAGGKSSSGVPVWCRWSKFHCRRATGWKRMLGRCAFGRFQSEICFPGSPGPFGHGAGGFADSSGDFWVKAQVHEDGGTD